MRRVAKQRDRRKAAERRAAEEAARIAAIREKQDREREAAQQAAEMIAERFGDDLPALIEVLADANLFVFRELLTSGGQ